MINCISFREDKWADWDTVQQTGLSPPIQKTQRGLLELVLRLMHFLTAT